jgi:tryptophan synthase beta chain
MTKGVYRFDYPGVSSNQYPRCKMYSLGYNYTPPNIHATGLRYHAVSPIISYLLNKNKFTPAAIPQEEALNAAKLLAKSEGIITAPESSYSIAKVIREANMNNGDVLLTAVTGNGYLDLNAYGSILNS